MYFTSATASCLVISAFLLIHRLDVDLFEFFRDCWAAPDNEISGNQALKILLFPLKRPLNDTQINGVNF